MLYTVYAMYMQCMYIYMLYTVYTSQIHTATAHSKAGDRFHGVAQGMAHEEWRQGLSLATVEPLQGFRQIRGIHMYLETAENRWKQLKQLTGLSTKAITKSQVKNGQSLLQEIRVKTMYTLLQTRQTNSTLFCSSLFESWSAVKCIPIISNNFQFH